MAHGPRALLLASILPLVACGAAQTPLPGPAATPPVNAAAPGAPVPPLPVPYPTAALHGVPDDFPREPLGTEPFSPEVYRERRARLLARLKSGVAVVFAAKDIDEDEERRQDPYFAYLTGLAHEDNAVLLLTPGGAAREVLFLKGQHDETDRWESYREGLPSRAVEVRTGFDEVRRTDRLPSYALAYTRESHDHALSLLVGAGGLDGPEPPDVELLHKIATRVPSASVVDASAELRAMRMAKEPRELEKIARATDITVAAHLEGWRVGKPGVREWDVKRTVEDAFRRGGARRFAYGSIAGSGPDGCVLHYPSDDRVIGEGELVLVDAGAEVDHYATDVTRTFPASGKFTAEQRAVYEVVLRAQKAAMAAVHAGVTWRELEAIAKKVIGEAGYYDFFIHGLGHHVGLEVHDISGATYLEPIPENAVITIEPGIYIPQKHMGIRIEDTIVVTKTGYRNLSEKLPREPDEIERWMATARSR
ncbi:MAG: Xaa-Pro peptidase family protein [Polyangiaceae bacterium]|jgi:Xaa-Pro aminopeptidase